MSSFGGSFVVYILGAGAAFPELELTTSRCHELGLFPGQQNPAVFGLINEFGVCASRCSLPFEYLKDTKNQDVIAGRAAALTSPTKLGVLAAEVACERAGITPSQVGMILGDSATPYQTCPSEAQRIGGGLGLKVPAYDIVAGPAFLPIVFSTISKWKAERLPEYILAVSANTPSQQIDYTYDKASASLFGDGASALILSSKHIGKLRVESAVTAHAGKSYTSLAAIDRHVLLNEFKLPLVSVVADAIYKIVSDVIESEKISREKVLLLGPEFMPQATMLAAERLSLLQKQIISTSSTHGYSIGSAQGAALAQRWISISQGQVIIGCHFGDGNINGYFVLQGEA